VGKTLKLPVARTALRWRRTTQKQSLLPLGQRRRNLAGALGVSRRSEFQGAHVLVLDDIMTTGATAGEAARVLRRAGAQFVTVGIVGRALVTGARGTSG
jgi:predicted amidophosphoribosyltransferase